MTASWPTRKQSKLTLCALAIERTLRPYSVPRLKVQIESAGLGVVGLADSADRVRSQFKLREETVAHIQRVRLAIHHSYLTARDATGVSPSVERILLHIVIYAKMFAF